MKTHILAISFFLTLSLSSLGQYTFMTNIQGQTGIDVDVTITFNQVIINSSNCANGFNYQIQYDYEVIYNQFGNGNGNNDLNTLQGYLACGPGNQSYFNLPNGGGIGAGLTANNWTSSTNCQNIQVQDLMCDMIDLVVQGPGIGYQVIALEAVSSLPVEFLDFSGEVNGDNIELSWSTASEKDNDYYLIERSFDGKVWNQWKQIEGAGTTSEKSEYTVNDDALKPLVYYKLTQVDFDGTTSELKTISLKDDGVALTAFPNPASAQMTIQGISQNTDLVIIDVTGKDQTSSVSFVPSSAQSITMDISALQPGVYYIRTGREQFRFIKN